MKICQRAREEGRDEIKMPSAGAVFGCLLASLTFQMCVRVFRKTLI